jgi:hypothetical protein
VLLLLACFSRHNKYFCGPNAYRTLKQAKQEKSKQKEATLKAMNTLKITKKGEELPEGAGGSGSLDKVRRSVQIHHLSAFIRIRHRVCSFCGGFFFSYCKYSVSCFLQCPFALSRGLARLVLMLTSNIAHMRIVVSLMDERSREADTISLPCCVSLRSVQEKTKARGPNRNTPMAIYNDLMKEAGRKPMDMYTPAADADSNDESDGESEDKVLAGSAPSVASTHSRKRGADDDDDDDDAAGAAFTTPHPTPGDARRGRGAAGKEPVAPIKQKTVAQLKGELAAMGLSTSGNKMVLKDRLSEVSHCFDSLLTCSVRNALTFLLFCFVQNVSLYAWRVLA